MYTSKEKNPQRGIAILNNYSLNPRAPKVETVLHLKSNIDSSHTDNGTLQ